MTGGKIAWRWFVLFTLALGAWFPVVTYRRLWRDHVKIHASLEHLERQTCTSMVTETDTTITFTGCGSDAVIDKTAPLVTFDGDGRRDGVFCHRGFVGPGVAARRMSLSRRCRRLVGRTETAPNFYSW